MINCFDECAPNCQTFYRGFRGQINPITATNFSTQILGWIPSQVFTAQCDGYVTATLNLPWMRSAARRTFMQSYIDVRLLVNGTPTLTRTNYRLWEHSELEDTNPDIIPPIRWRDEDLQAFWSIPVSAGDEIQTDWRIKARSVRAQSSAYARILVYRDESTFENAASPVLIPRSA